MTLLPNMGIVDDYILPYLLIIMDRGIPGGEENGKKGYVLTFVVAYIRVCVCLSVCVCVHVCLCLCACACV